MFEKTRHFRIGTTCLGLIAAGSLGLAAGNANAAAMFDVNTSSSPTASGFAGLAVSDSIGTGNATSDNGTPGDATDDITATITANGAPGTANRGLSSDLLLTDLVFGRNATDPTPDVSIDFTGLSPNTTYDFTLYSFDSENISQGDVTDFFVGAQTTPLLNDVTVASSLDRSAAANTAQFTTGAGQTTLTINGVNAADSTTSLTVVNGFEVGVIPEPASAALLAVGGAVMLLPRRRGRRALDAC